MDRLHGLTTFVHVVESRSFSATARLLGVSPSSVSATIVRLERKLSVRLLNRTTRSVSPTPEGAELYERGKKIIADIEEVERSVSLAGRVPSGKLLVAMPEALGRMYVIPRLGDFTALYPAIALEIVLDNFITGIASEGLDAAIQVGELPSSSLLVRKLASVDFLLCASPAYLAARGTPATPEDLAAHSCITYRRPRNGQIRLWKLKGVPPLQFSPVGGLATLNSGDGLVAAALSDLGIVQVASYYAQPFLDSGELVEVLPQHRTYAYDISLVFPVSKRASPRLRAFIDFLVRIFEGPVWQRPGKAPPVPGETDAPRTSAEADEGRRTQMGSFVADRATPRRSKPST